MHGKFPKKYLEIEIFDYSDKFPSFFFNLNLFGILYKRIGIPYNWRQKY
jgi:hypothetical protein